MSDWLLLRTPRAASVSWLVADAAGRPLSAVASGTLAQAAAAAVGRRVAVLLAPAEVLLAEVELPARSGARAGQLVPYALEEQLVGDVEAQHFALAERAAADGRTRVAVIAHAELEALLQALRAADIEPARIVSEAALVPAGPQHATLMLDGETLCLLPPGGGLPIVLPAADLGAALELALGAAALATTSLLCVATPLDWQRRTAEVEALRPRLAALKVQLASSGLLPWLAPQLTSPGAINLLQGRHAQHAAWSAGWPRWRVAALLAAALVLLYAGGQLWTLLQLRSAERTLTAATEEFANRVMPGGGSVQLRQRAEQRLLAAQRAADDAGFLSALGALADAAPAGGDGVAIQTLQFQGGTLEIKLRAADAERLERLSQRLRAAGWRTEITGGGAVSGGYEGHIRLVRG
jgi:general secretion pathway protein L